MHTLQQKFSTDVEAAVTEKLAASLIGGARFSRKGVPDMYRKFLSLMEGASNMTTGALKGLGAKTKTIATEKPILGRAFTHTMPAEQVAKLPRASKEVFSNPIVDKIHNTVQSGLKGAVTTAPAAADWVGRNMPSLQLIVDALT